MSITFKLFNREMFLLHTLKDASLITNIKTTYNYSFDLIGTRLGEYSEYCHAVTE